MSVSFDFGKNAENFAAEYLIKNNYEIIERNWRVSRLEIDIIAKKNNIIVFVEVKARKNYYRNLSAFNIEDIITPKKQKNIINAAEKYLDEKNLDLELRFDLILVFKTKNEFKIEHIPNAYYSMLE